MHAPVCECVCTCVLFYIAGVQSVIFSLHHTLYLAHTSFFTQGCRVSTTHLIRPRGGCVGAVASCAEPRMIYWVFFELAGAGAPRASCGVLRLLRPSRSCVLHGGIGAVASCAGLSLQSVSVRFRFLVLSLLSPPIRLPPRAARLRRTRTSILSGTAITTTSSLQSFSGLHQPVSTVPILAWARPGRIFLGFVGHQKWLHRFTLVHGPPFFFH